MIATATNTYRKQLLVGRHCRESFHPHQAGLAWSWNISGGCHREAALVSSLTTTASSMAPGLFRPRRPSAAFDCWPTSPSLGRHSWPYQTPATLAEGPIG